MQDDVLLERRGVGLAGGQVGDAIGRVEEREGARGEVRQARVPERPDHVGDEPSPGRGHTRLGCALSCGCPPTAQTHLARPENDVAFAQAVRLGDRRREQIADRDRGHRPRGGGERDPRRRREAGARGRGRRGRNGRRRRRLDGPSRDQTWGVERIGRGAFLRLGQTGDRCGEKQENN